MHIIRLNFVNKIVRENKYKSFRGGNVPKTRVINYYKKYFERQNRFDNQLIGFKNTELEPYPSLLSILIV